MYYGDELYLNISAYHIDFSQFRGTSDELELVEFFWRIPLAGETEASTILRDSPPTCAWVNVNTGKIPHLDDDEERVESARWPETTNREVTRQMRLRKKIH